MINVDDIDNSQLKLVSLHNIDFNHTENAVRRDINIEDAQQYILQLTKKMLNYNNVREYKPRSLTKEVIYQVLKLCTCFTSEELSAASTEGGKAVSIESLNDIIANRLLHEQIETEKKHPNLNKVKKGSLIQSLIELEDEYIFIIALVEHHKFIDNTDLKYKIGMPDEDKIALKSARIHLTKNVDITHIFLSDTTNTIRDYWYNGFLELDETVDNVTNTKRAYSHYETILRHSLSSKSPADFSELQNALKIYFSHNDKFSHEDCIGFLFNSYTPIKSDVDISNIKEKFIKSDIKKTFDNTFDINIADIKNKLTNIKYKVNDNIDLKLKKPLEEIKSTIYTYKLPTLENVIIIKNVDSKTLKKFNFNNIDL